MPVKPRWTDRALKSAALIAASLLFVIAFASSPVVKNIASGITALNSGRSSGLTPSTHGGTGQSAVASAPGSSDGRTANPGSKSMGPAYQTSNGSVVGNAPTTTATSIGLWASDWGGAAAKRSTAGWQAAARNDRILIGNAGVYPKWIPQLHGWNPNLTVLVYNVGPYLQKGTSTYSQVLSAHPTWFAHDSHGRLINLPMFPSNYLMDAGSAAYRAWHATQLAASVSGGGFDGAMVDSVGDDVLGHYASGVPVNPSTHQTYSVTTWLGDEVLLLNSDKAAIGGKYLAFNGLVSGPDYARDSSILATANADAGIAELFLRQPKNSINAFPSATEMQQSLAMMTAMAARGKAFLGWTKVWVSASSAQLAKWETFSLGVYLLGRSSASYLDFMPSHSADNTVISYSNLTTNLGAALGPYTVSGSTFTRSFQSGKVTVNASTYGVSIQVV
jgi:hypothetical protein